MPTNWQPTNQGEICEDTKSSLRNTYPVLLRKYMQLPGRGRPQFIIRWLFQASWHGALWLLAAYQRHRSYASCCPFALVIQAVKLKVIFLPYQHHHHGSIIVILVILCHGYFIAEFFIIWLIISSLYVCKTLSGVLRHR